MVEQFKVFLGVWVHSPLKLMPDVGLPLHLPPHGLLSIPLLTFLLLPPKGSDVALC